MPCARHSSAILAPALDACSTNEIFELMTRCSFQGIPRLSTCQRSHGRKPVSDVLALDRGRGSYKDSSEGTGAARSTGSPRLTRAANQKCGKGKGTVRTMR